MLTRAHQFTATVAYGDAIGNDTFELQRLFWQRGITSDIFAVESRPGVEPFVRPWEDLCAEPADAAALLIHHSMGNEAIDRVAELPTRKAVVYHNITPSRYFVGISEQLVRHSDLGREQLRRLARSCELGIADSEFNRVELEEAGFLRTAVVPIFTDATLLDLVPDAAVARELADERTNVLVVGQILPHKAIHDVLDGFARYRASDPSARLYLVGPSAMSGLYLDQLRDRIERLGIRESVRLTGNVPIEHLVAYYRGATVLLHLSDHEGFNVPVLEAMRFGVPVVAHAAGATPETLGDAGVLLERKSADDVASALERVVGDARLRRSLIERGQTRLSEFARTRVTEKLEQAFRTIGWDLPAERRRAVTVISSDQRCGIHHYALEVCAGLRALGHDVTFVGVRHLDTADLRRKLRHVARGELVLIEHEAGIFRDVPFVQSLLGLKRTGHRIVLSLHELEPEKFHHYRLLSAALHYRPRFRSILELGRIFWVALRIANWFIRYRLVLALMGALPDRLVVHSSRSGYWLDLLTHRASKRDEFPLLVMPLEDAELPTNAEGRRALRRELGLPEDAFIFVSPGFFFPRKRYREVITATPDDAVLVLSGTRSEREPTYFDEVIAAAERRANVIVSTDYDAMGRYVAAADAVVLYYEDVFQSAVVTQAIWAGLPCIFSTTPGFRPYHAAGLVARDDAELREQMLAIRVPETYERLRAGASVLRRLLAPERLAARYLIGID